MNRVWMVKQGEHDTTAASAGGREIMQPIFAGDACSPYNIARQEEIIRQEVLPFADGDDFVLTVGPQVMVAVLTGLWVTEFGRVKFLVWNKWRGIYVEKTLLVARRISSTGG